MCGIAGVVRQSGSIERDPSALLSEALAHRGPDGAGVWRSADGHVALVHRRLAIIDPGPRAAQPMRTPDGRHHIVFNGEVYNYVALRRSLSDRGEHFTTGSDTEVLLRLLARDGPDALARVRGMFALAWWDDRERTLILARDRFGIKPLYVAATADTLAFASEIRALTASGLVQRRIDPAGVMAYLSWGTVPASLTWMEGVESLTPGTWLRRTVDGLTVQRPFADVAAVYARPGAVWGERAVKGRVRGAVQDSVAAHLVADVPVGVFLSGGIDSSAILSAAVNAGARGLNTYTVRFDDSASEHEYAGLVASTFGSTHHELVLDSSRIVDDLPRILRHLDQPTLDAVNSFYVSEAVAKTGIKAVLSGAGGRTTVCGRARHVRGTSRDGRGRRGAPRDARLPRLAAPARPGCDVDGAFARGACALRRSRAARRGVARPRSVSRPDAQQTLAARNTRAGAAARGGQSSQAGVHLAVRPLDAWRARAVRAIGNGVPRQV